jgi:membrane protein required for beta-lactamase induction
MNDYSFHLNITQDIGHGMTLIFICAVAILLAVLIDLSTGVERAKKCKEKIRSHILRRTISKVVDYYRLLFFGVIIDVLGLAFVWYNMPYCAVVVAVGVVLIEAKSVLENYQKMKSAARAMPDVVRQIVEAVTDKDAEKIVELIKDNDKRDEDE